MNKLKKKVIFVFAVFLLSSFLWQAEVCLAETSAERLTSVLPDNVIGFVATSGADELKPAFEKTILGRIWYDASMQSFYKSIKTEIVNKLKQEIGDANEAKMPEKIVSFAQMVLKRPIIAGAAEDKTNSEFPFYGFVIVDTGTRKAEAAKALTELEGLVDEGEIVDVDIAGLKMRGLKDADDVRLYWGWAGSYLVFAVNDEKGLAVKYLSGPINRPVTDYLSKVEGNGDALAIYIDFQKMADVFKSIANREGGEKEVKQITAILNELGLSEVKAVKSRIGFSGADLVCDELVELEQQRKGMFGCIRPVSVGMLDMVDSRVVNVSALNINIGGIYDTIMNAIKTASPNDLYAEAQDAIREAETEAGFSIRKELLGSFAGPAVVYSMPAGIMTEAPSGGFIAIFRLRDAQVFEKVMKNLGDYAAANSEGAVQVSSQEQEGRTIHTFAIMPLAMMQIMPTWTVVDGYVVIGMNGPLCSVAVKQVTADNRRASSIRETANFKKATSGLARNAVYLSYTDSRAQFNKLMMSTQQFWPMVTMMAAQQGIKLPFMLPSLSHIVEEMGPSCGYCWFDSDGLRSRYKGVGVEQSFGMVAGASVGAGVMFPALVRTRQIAQRTVSATNLSGIGKALVVYANDYDGKYPPDLETLVKTADLSPKMLESKRKPKDFTGPSYIYITGQSALMDAGNIVVYENPKFCKDGVNVLHNDTHVEFMKREKFIEALKETYERLGREMPEIKFRK